MKRLVTGGALIVFALAGLAGTAAARGPDGRVFSGAKFSSPLTPTEIDNSFIVFNDVSSLNGAWVG